MRLLSPVCLQCTLDFMLADDVPVLLSVDEALCQEVAVLLCTRFVAGLRRMWLLDTDSAVPAPGSGAPWMNAAGSFLLAHDVVPSQLMRADPETTAPRLLLLDCAAEVHDATARVAVTDDNRHYVAWAVRVLGGQLPLTDPTTCCVEMRPTPRAAIRLVRCNADAFYDALAQGHHDCATFQAQLGAAPQPFDSDRIDESLTHLCLPDAYATLEHGFAGWRGNLTSIDLSSCASLTSIAGFAYGCSNLTAVTIPPSVLLIGASFCSQSGVTHIDLTACLGLTTVGDYFATQCTALTSVRLPATLQGIGVHFCSSSNIADLDLTGCGALTKIADDFARACAALTSVRLPPGLRQIGENFCSETVALRTLDLSHCVHLSALGDYFANSTNLTSFDLSGCAALTACPRYATMYNDSLVKLELPATIQRIGEGFCNRTDGVLSLELSLLVQLRTLDEGFAFSCHTLTSLNLSGCVSLTSIGKKFAFACRSLSSVALPNSLCSVGSEFCCQCNELTLLDLSCCDQLTVIEDKFAASCGKLMEVKLPSTVTRIHSSFCGWRTGLQALDVVQLRTLSFIGERFVADTSLRRLDLSPCSSLSTISSHFASSCSHLTEVVLPSSVTHVDKHFLWSAQELVTLDVSRCTVLTSIGKSFVVKCAALLSLDLSTCVGLTDIPDDFATSCASLKSVTLPSSVTSIGSMFCSAAHALESMDLSNCALLSRIGRDFASSCAQLTRINLEGCVALTKVEERFASGNARLKTVLLPRGLETVYRGFCVGSPGVLPFDWTRFPSAVVDQVPATVPLRPFDDSFSWS